MAVETRLEGMRLRAKWIALGLLAFLVAFLLRTLVTCVVPASKLVDQPSLPSVEEEQDLGSHAESIEINTAAGGRTLTDPIISEQSDKGDLSDLRLTEIEFMPVDPPDPKDSRSLWMQAREGGWRVLVPGVDPATDSPPEDAWYIVRYKGGPAVLVDGVTLGTDMSALIPEIRPIRLSFTPPPSRFDLHAHSVVLRSIEALPSLEGGELRYVDSPSNGLKVQVPTQPAFGDTVRFDGYLEGWEGTVGILPRMSGHLGIEVKIQETIVSAPETREVPWQVVDLLEIRTRGIHDASGTVFLRPHSNTDSHTWLTNLVDGFGSTDPSYLRPGDYEVVAIGPGWVSETPPPRIRVEDDVVTPMRVYLDAIPVEEATIEFNTELSSSDRRRVDYLGNTGVFWGLRPAPIPNAPCAAHWVGNTLHLVGLSEPTKFRWFNEDRSVAIHPTLGPGDHIRVDANPPPERIFEEARELARAMKLAQPDLGWVRLHIELDGGQAGSKWVQVFDRDLQKPFAFDDRQWLLRVNPSAHYRLGPESTEPETHTSIVIED